LIRKLKTKILSSVFSFDTRLFVTGKSNTVNINQAYTVAYYFETQSREQRQLQQRMSQFLEMDLFAHSDNPSEVVATGNYALKVYTPGRLELQEGTLLGHNTLTAPKMATEDAQRLMASDGALNCRATLTCSHKGQMLWSSTIGDTWSPRLEAHHGIRFRSCEGLYHAVTYNPSYAALWGGTDAGSRVTSLRTFSESMGYAVSVPSREMATVMETLHSRQLQLDRVLVRMASLFLSLRHRAGPDGYRTVGFGRVDPPEYKCLNSQDQLLECLREAASGRLTVTLRGDRPAIEQTAYIAVLQTVLTRKLDWPSGTRFVSDLFWPSLGTQSVGQIVITPRTIMPPADTRLTYLDVLIAAECLLADLGIPGVEFSGVVDSTLAMCMHETSGTLCGLSTKLNIALPEARISALALLPLFERPPVMHTTTLTLRARSAEDVFQDAIGRADAVRRAWWALADSRWRVAIGISTAPRTKFNAMCVRAPSARALWAAVGGMLAEMGHDGNVGRMMGSAVAEGAISHGTEYVTAPHSMRCIPPYHPLGLRMHPPHDGIGLRQLLTEVGDTTLPGYHRFASWGLIMHDDEGNVSHVTKTPTDHSLYPDTCGGKKVYPTCGRDDPLIEEALGPQLKYRSQETRWYIGFDPPAQLNGKTIEKSEKESCDIVSMTDINGELSR
jgi:hypothetical protein